MCIINLDQDKIEFDFDIRRYNFILNSNDIDFITRFGKFDYFNCYRKYKYNYYNQITVKISLKKYLYFICA